MRLKSEKEVYGKYFQQFDPNPKNDHASDCVIRAICKLTGKDWDTVYDYLAKLGKKLKDVPCGFSVIMKFLEVNGAKRVRQGKWNLTVLEIAQLSQKKQETYFVFLTGHVLIVENGIVFDRNIRGLFSQKATRLYKIGGKYDIQLRERRRVARRKEGREVL